MTHTELLTAYGKKYHGKKYHLDKANQVVFEMTGKPPVYAESHPEDDVLVLQAVVAVVSDPNPGLLKALLAGNVVYRGKENIATAYNIVTKEVLVIMKLIGEDMDADALTAALVLLQEEAAYWRGVIEDGEERWDFMNLAPNIGIDFTRSGTDGMA